jgi:hypothetical protein
MARSSPCYGGGRLEGWRGGHSVEAIPLERGEVVLGLCSLGLFAEIQAVSGTQTSDRLAVLGGSQLATHFFHIDQIRVDDLVAILDICLTESQEFCGPALVPSHFSLRQKRRPGDRSAGRSLREKHDATVRETARDHDMTHLVNIL